MIKPEKILLLLLISICLLVSIIMVDALVDPAVLIATVFASTENSSEVITEENVVPSLEEIPLLLEDDWQVYRNEGFAFEISYPNTVIQKSTLDQGALNAGIGVSPGTPVWQFRLDDKGNYQGTNLIDASLVIHVGNQEGDTSRCSEFKPGSINKIKLDALPVIEIDGISFWQDVVQEGVMGGRYYQVSYRAVYQGACYEITQLIHSSNQESFAGESISPFDLEKVTGKLDKVLETFKFLDGPATFPPQSYPEPKSAAGAVDKDATEHVDGLDVSHWQGDINWTKVALNDYIFTFAKGTEGVGWTDVNFFTNITEGTEAGVVMGVYHFARPDLGNTGQEEAEYFLSVVGDYLESGYLRPVLDLEVGSYLGKEALSAWVLDWLQTVENQSGVAPLIYTNYNYVSYFLTDPVADYDLWIAYWNCNPTPTYDIPPTGMWSDWGFWQYCVKSAGYVPGIHTPIDVNIFNGVEEGLSEFDAASPLWVSFTNYTTAAPAPHYADITADVNGDAVGNIDYAFWWNCTSLEVDITAASASCGALPTPAEGECLGNEYGVRCSAVPEEIKMVEHTYQEIGDYTAKVIVERGEAAPAEDRYHITVYNPIRSITAVPATPDSETVLHTFDLHVDVIIDTSIAGALQAEIIEDGSGEKLDSGCMEIPNDTKMSAGFDFSFPENEEGLVPYTIWARYRLGENCPIMDENPDDISQKYEIEWLHPMNDRVGFFDPAAEMWKLKTGNNSLFEVDRFLWGSSSGDWIPVTGDWDNDGIDTAGFYDPNSNIWRLRTSNDIYASVDRFIWGPIGEEWIPITGDWDGDGVDTAGFYDPNSNIWRLKTENSTSALVYWFAWGPIGEEWIPITGDWDGDGVDTAGFYDPVSKVWRFKTENLSSAPVLRLTWGLTAGWIPVIGDWNNDGVDAVGFYDPTDKLWRLKTENTWAAPVNRFIWGPEGEIWLPISGVW